ncbi:3-phenylpropionate/cinnamic acid dioxygenase ferredoxin--NAD(+) reductase subunit [Burkholderia sp. JPY481]|uniref:3-phenylpropionate/cinnamic acid dioxygenase ferredoxin--NAD(+) reductase subunit n=1 Tax=Paraburkholderia sp. JPY465 TaxID=3042285 RepID=UPI003173F245
MTSSTFVIVGAGQAGANAAAELRHQGFDGRIVLVGDEAHAPYERPPLSKDVLLRPEETRCAMYADDFYQQKRIELRLGVTVVGLDLSSHVLALSTGESVAFDKLLIATGARARRLPLLDALGEGVHTLRTLDDARRLRDDLRPGRHVIVVGAGVIGLEIASSAVDLGARVTVLEAGPRAMGRNAPSMLADWLCDVHRGRGVELIFGAQIESAARVGGEIVLTLGDGTTVTGDTVLYGVGAIPDTALAEAAGLAIANGIAVDAQYRTSHPDVFAAGDVAGRQDPVTGRVVRLETWENAQNQGVAAARAMLGLTVEAPGAPWFWTDQCGLNIQLVGEMAASDWVVRGALDAPPAVLFGLDAGGALTGAITVNQGRDMRSLRELVARHVVLAREVLADSAQSLRNLAKVAA